MARYIIEGGTVLKGTIKIGGNKNAVLPCLAACLLTDRPVTLYNVPKISDVQVMLEILQNLGASVEQTDDSVTVTVDQIHTTDLPEELTGKLRASILLVGPLLARAGKVRFSHPGGDVIGKRSIQTHLDGLTQMGYQIEAIDQNRQYIAKRQ